MLSFAWIFSTPWTIAHLSMGFSQQEDWSKLPFFFFSFRVSSQPRNQTHTFCFSCIAGGFFTTKPPEKPHRYLSSNKYPMKCDRGWALSEVWSLDRLYISEDKWNVLSVGELWSKKAVELEYGQSCWSWVWKPSLGPCSTFVEKDMATHSSTLAWKIPWMEGPGRLQSMGLWRVGHVWAISLSLFTFMHWRRKWQPTPVFLPGESQGQSCPVGRCLWGRTELDATDVT